MCDLFSRPLDDCLGWEKWPSKQPTARPGHLERNAGEGIRPVGCAHCLSGPSIFPLFFVFPARRSPPMIPQGTFHGHFFLASWGFRTVWLLVPGGGYRTPRPWFSRPSAPASGAHHTTCVPSPFVYGPPKPTQKQGGDFFSSSDCGSSKGCACVTGSCGVDGRREGCLMQQQGLVGSAPRVRRGHGPG